MNNRSKAISKAHHVQVVLTSKVAKLRTVDNFRVLMFYNSNYTFSDDQVENMRKLRNLVSEVNWPLGIQIWKRFFSFEHNIAAVPENITSDFGEPCFPNIQPPKSAEKSKRKSKGNKWKKKRELKDKLAKDTDQVNDKNEHLDGVQGEPVEALCNTDTVQLLPVDAKDNVQKDCTESVEVNAAKKPRVRENPWNPLMPSFRVTCHRTGDSHNFDSMTAAANFGGAIYCYFGWNVKMTEFDMEVLLNIDEHQVAVSMGLTKESLHKRDITTFGPTTLRPTVANGMLRLCEIQTGDIVCDPMCGAGSIPIQGILSGQQSFHLAGEIGKNCLNRVRSNLKFLSSESTGKVDAIRWDVCNLPLRDKSVDVFITDLPFGVRMGHKVENWRLYPGALLEMARVVQPESGRCCLLTEDQKCLFRSLQKWNKYWTRSKTLVINLGGLAAGVFVLSRTRLPFNMEDRLTMLREFKRTKGGHHKDSRDKGDNPETSKGDDS
ncbi:tRNA (guanine(6)-N2)-methyltransferase THUMP3-like isoform X2 [Dreissena polymorpha]|uniref:tRNA (guanine(6)-N2)-methyltransferase THUMP3-like isoform X2 n=1 Tax=Dreissena polymorpha TaxID=45954 RepID=UPI002263AC47|nr:tRNA (guanine(6)-N2)-methyltransferase THUMP3-like isoform X2 [Dreissena polymorpha]